MKHYDSRLQAAFLETADIRHWSSPYAVTLTMKQAIHRGGINIYADPLKASQNLRHFLKLLNAKLFTKAQRRKGHQIRCIPVLEDGSRYHYHLCVDKPAGISHALFDNLVRALWQRTDYGYWMVEVAPADFGWIRYMAKQRSKSVFADAIDWENFHNPI